MGKQWRLLFFFLFFSFSFFSFSFVPAEATRLRRVLFDTDVNSDDIFALLYLLKQDASFLDIKAITISANAFCNAGHGANHIYDVLYMMDRDDIIVGVGGEGGVLPNGTILPHLGGYLPLIEQGTSTIGDCRYRQSINRGEHGLLSVDTSYGLRRSFLPQGERHYSPLHQPTAQQVMFDAVSEGPITVFASGSLTNLGIFIMTHPELKQNIEHVYVMGGGVRSKTEFDCEPKNDNNDACKPSFCGDPGNLFTYSNPYAEFNVFVDPFAAYQVMHSGLPITLIPLDATNTIPINHEFYDAFERYRDTYEAEYCFQMLKIIRDTWFVSDFFNSYYMWDSFAAGVAVSSMKNEHPDDENEFAELEYMNITVVTSNEPYGEYDGSNLFFDGLAAPKFGLKKDGVHSGHVQTGPTDPFCHVLGIQKGICQDGYTKEDDETGVRVLVATKAKPNLRTESTLDREFYSSFLDVLNVHRRSARFNLSSQFPYYREIIYKPDLKGKKLGKPLVFDMDISVGDVLALIYLLKVPVEVIDLKGVLVNGNGWTNAATIDIVYDVLHMMGRDDIPVGLGNFTAIGTPSHSCKYVKHVPHGHGGLIDSDTLFGLARNLPRSPRCYTAQTQGKHRQPSAMQVWRSISNSISGENKINILTNGPLTNLASIILSDKKASSIIQSLYIVGGHITDDSSSKKGNVFTYPKNEYAEFNMFLDPLAAKKVIESDLEVTLIPLTTQSKVNSFEKMLKKLKKAQRKTPESMFAYHLLSRLQSLRKCHQEYNHMDMFLGEIIGAVTMVENENLNPKTSAKFVNVLVGDMKRDGEIVVVNESHGKQVNVVESVDEDQYYARFANSLADKKQSAVVASFAEQKKIWSSPPDDSNGGDDEALIQS